MKKEDIYIALKKHVEYRNKNRLKRGERLAGPDDNFFGAELLGAKETFETRLKEENTTSSEKVSEHDLSGPEM
jgi:hypothetical protein